MFSDEIARRNWTPQMHVASLVNREGYFIYNDILGLKTQFYVTVLLCFLVKVCVGESDKVVYKLVKLYSKCVKVHFIIKYNNLIIAFYSEVGVALIASCVHILLLFALFSGSLLKEKLIK